MASKILCERQIMTMTDSSTSNQPLTASESPNNNPIRSTQHLENYLNSLNDELSHEAEYQTSEEKIVLNVGGVKYETYPSTFIRYPDTFLGLMFHPRNKSLLRPKNGNEYFFDRNGHAFHYILEFYRTGKIPWHRWNSFARKRTFSETTQKELQEELDYFQIKVDDNRVEMAEIAAAAVLNDFICALEDLILKGISQMVGEIRMKFFKNGDPPIINLSSILEDYSLLTEFSQNGYYIIAIFWKKIDLHLPSLFPSIISVGTNDTGIGVINLTINGYLNEESIIKHSSFLK
ncbi:hypothetical protein G9A89_002324 [Geosiphon pyriformis]|nr:hypothetical protein G9A89_002324 [Geosiphon pyriformis]